MMVPIEWFITLGSALVGVFVWWVKSEFTRNDKMHDTMEKSMVNVNKRVDHLILHLLPDAPYKDDE